MLEKLLKRIPKNLNKAVEFLAKVDQGLTVIESPFASNPEAIPYLHACCRHSLTLGEVPFASHGFYTQFLNDGVVEERNLGIYCGYAVSELAAKVVFYEDLGFSAGMMAARERVLARDLPFIVRRLGEGWRSWNV